MGAIIQWVIRGLMIGGPAAIGYFMNDFATWIANVTGTGEKVVKDGKFTWWFIAIVAVVLGAVVYFIALMFKGGKKKGGLL